MYYIVARNDGELEIEEYDDWFIALFCAGYEGTILTKSREEAEKYIQEQNSMVTKGGNEDA